MIDPISLPTADGYKAYFASKMGDARRPSPTFALDEATEAARELTGQYDLGVALAADGLSTGYIFNSYGLPIKAVKLSRRGMGATWQPLDEIADQDVRNKRLLLFEWDVSTGRTLKRAIKELGKYSPQYLDLLLVCGKTLLPFGYCDKHPWFKPKGNLELDQRGRAAFWMDCEPNVPRGIRKIMTLIPDNHRR